MDEKDEVKFTENPEEQKPKKSRLLTILGVTALLIIAAVWVTASLSTLSDRKQQNIENGYTEFEYCKEYKVIQSSSKECKIGNSVYTFIEQPRENYFLENRGKYNKYGFYFGDGPDFYMMSFDRTGNEFWFKRQLVKYPEVGKDEISALVIPNKNNEIFRVGSSGISRIDFGDSPVTVADKSIIEKATAEYKETFKFNYTTNLAENGTPIFVKFKDSCLYFLIGYTTEG